MTTDDLEILFEVIKTDSSPEVRLAALSKIDDPQLLESLVGEKLYEEAAAAIREHLDQLYTDILVSESGDVEQEKIIAK